MIHVRRAIAEMRDAWAIAIAEIAAVATYQLGAPVWLALATAGTVLTSRVAAGFWFPTRTHPIPPKTTLAKKEADLAKYVAAGFNAVEIAAKLDISEAQVRRIRRSIYDRLGLRQPWELREWLIEVGWIKTGLRDIVKELLDSEWVRATLAVGGLVSLLSRLSDIYFAQCHLLPPLPCPVSP